MINLTVQRILIIILGLMGSVFVHAQPPVADTVTAMRMKDTAMRYESIDTALSARYYREAAAFAIQHKLDYEAGIIYHNMSYLFQSGTHYQQALRALDTALFFIGRSTHPKKALVTAKIHQTQGANYRYINQNKEAVSYALLSIGEFEKLKEYSSVVKGYFNLAQLYKNAGEYQKQLECAEKAVQVAMLSGVAEDRFIAYTVEVHSYTNLTDFKQAAVARDSALRYYDSSYPKLSLIAFHLVSGLINSNLKEPEKAIADFKRSLALAEAAKGIFSIVQSKMQLAHILTGQKKFAAAESYLRSADSTITNSKEQAQRMVLINYYAELYEAKGDLKKTLAYYQQYILLNDSMTKLESRKYINELEAKYESGKKKAQIENLQLEQKVQQLTIRQRTSLIYILAGLAIVLVIASVFAYKSYRQKQRLQRQRIVELETQQQLMATEAVLKGEELERTRLAKDLHDGLGGMLSGIKYSLDTMKRNLIMTPENQQAFERSIDMLDSSIHEMRRVAHNMMPESLVNLGVDAALKEFCDDMTETGAIAINYQSIGLQGEQIDQTTGITIYRIIQELVNNIMKHAAAKQAIVQVSKAGTRISITVEDDGKGFDAAMLGNATAGRGMGWSNIQNRVGLLKGRLDIKSLPGIGTSVLIEFNL